MRQTKNSERSSITVRAGLRVGAFWLVLIALTAGASTAGCGGDDGDRTTKSLVTSLDDSGTESSPSTTDSGLTREDDTGVVPLAPAELTADVQGGKVVLTWRGTGSDIVEAYELLRKSGKDDEYRTLGRIGIEGDNRGDYSFSADAATGGRSSGGDSYGVVAIDRDDMRSEMTVTAPVAAH